MAQIHLIIFICILIKTFAFLNESERNITIELINNLKIQHWILVEDFNNDPDNLNIIKYFVKLRKPFTYLFEEKIDEYFLKQSFVNANTLIVFKISELKIIRIIINYLQTGRKHDYLCSFKWMAFVDHELTISEEIKLFIPYNCFFIIAYPKDSNVYYLKEIYKVKNKFFSLDYGMWTKDFGLTIKKEFIYDRRINLNNAKIILATTSKNDCESQAVNYFCAHLKIIRDFSKLMNFSLVWRSDLVNATKLDKKGDIIFLSGAYSGSYTYDADRTAPFFKAVLNWYIRKPSYYEAPDYYIRVFNYELWYSIFGCIIIGVIFGILYRYLTNQSEIDFVFLAFESMCNQDGFSRQATNSYKIACFMFRFLALFIISAYSGTILAFLAVKKTHVPFETLEGLVKNREYLVGGLDETFGHGYFMFSTNSFIHHVYENYFVVFENFLDMNERICNEKSAGVLFGNGNHDFSCPVHQLKEPITYVFTSTVMLNHIPLTKIFSYRFLRYYSSGLQEKMQKKIYEDYIPDVEVNSVNGVTIDQTTQILSFVPFGIVLAVTILFCEIFWVFFQKMLKMQLRMFLWKRGKTAE